MTLDRLPTRRTAEIEAIEHDEEGHWRKLASFGFLPGAKVEMLQRWPAFVVRIGMTDVGLDDRTARLVSLRDPTTEQPR
jgi:Fe2+ transport system protein FeoA